MSSKSMNLVYIDYHYNFQMPLIRNHFLFVLFLAFIAKTQVLTSVSSCLGNCTTCDPISLAKCKICDDSYYAQKNDGICILAPSNELVSHQLDQSSSKSLSSLLKGWSHTKKQAICEYLSPEGKNYIEILGLYSGVQVLQRAFQVDNLSDSFELTFDLVFSEWLPINDFLIVDILSKDDTLLSAEISFDTRISVNSQPAIIICNGIRTMIKKYSLKFSNSYKVGQITAVFTSFLFNAFWGITNVRLIQGCLGYSHFNPKTQKCSTCDSDTYAVRKATADWCEKCPLLCKTCESKVKCLTCITGAVVNKSGLCDFGDKSKTQVVPLGDKMARCDGQFKMMSTTSKFMLNEVVNDENLLYEEIQVGFVLYYLPGNWKSTKNYISVRLNKIQIMKVDFRNLTNTGFIRCSPFKENRAAKIQIFSGKIVHNENTVTLDFELVGTEKDIQIGIGSVRIKSMIKNEAEDKSAISVPKIITQNTGNSNQKTNSSNQPKNESSPPSKSDSSPQVIVVPTLVLQKQTKSIVPIPQNSNLNSSNNLPSRIQNFSNSSANSPTNPSSGNSSKQEAPVQKIQVRKYIEDLMTKTQQSQNISFLPSSFEDNSGLRIYIKGQSSSQNVNYKVYIDKLDASEYQLATSTVQEGKLNLFIKIDKSFTNGNIAIYSITTSRLLREGPPQLLANFRLSRFDSLTSSQLSSIQGFNWLFTIVAWVAIILVFCAVLMGYGVVFEEFVISLQVLFLHVFIGSEYFPLTFREVIGGLKRVLSLNFFASSHRQSIESWLGNSSKNLPIRFYLYSDTFFLRQFYPIIVANLIYLFWFCCLIFAKKRMEKKLDQPETSENKFEYVTKNILKRILNFFDQIWRLQFLTTIWLSLVQFHDLTSPNNSAALNGLICVLAFICSLSWPVFVTLHCRSQYYSCQYSEYLYFYQDVYYGRIPQYELPSSHHRIGYNLIKAAKLFGIALVVCYAGSILALFSLITFQVGELFYAKSNQIYIDKKYWLLRVIENSLFVMLQLIAAVMLTCNRNASSEAYKAIGYLLSGLGLLVVINSAVRVSYLGSRKWKDLDLETIKLVNQLKKPQTQRVV